MIERVKKAVRNEWGSRLCKPNEYFERPCEHGSICACLEVARAAIEAMREPSMEMCSAGEDSGFLHWSPEEGEGLDEVDMAAAYRAMIDAALEKGK
jgi:hypothetical protein